MSQRTSTKKSIALKMGEKMSLSASKPSHFARYGKVRKLEKQVYHRKGKVYKGSGPRGSGHQAGEGWGEAKNIDPESIQRVYSKRGRSPSFDQGVNNYKVKAHNKELTSAKLDKFFKKI